MSAIVPMGQAVTRFATLLSSATGKRSSGKPAAPAVRQQQPAPATRQSAPAAPVGNFAHLVARRTPAVQPVAPRAPTPASAFAHLLPRAAGALLPPTAIPAPRTDLDSTAAAGFMARAAAKARGEEMPGKKRMQDVIDERFQRHVQAQAAEEAQAQAGADQFWEDFYRTYPDRRFGAKQ